ncbi:MAG: hypothetical protein WC340_01530 [Kiritimatiellia bacterium]
MALTNFQAGVCRIIATNRKTAGDSYIAGGSALNVLLNAPRLSHDIDIFHDTTEALHVSWNMDNDSLREHGYNVDVVREAPSFVEAFVSKGGDQVILQWVRDSAFRFFPLIEDDYFGLTMHPFDLATNKVLALVGRLEIRDWIDVQQCSQKIQHLGLLAWAACGKDPGFSPVGILNEAARSSRYTHADLERLDFIEPPADICELSRCWKHMLKEGLEIIDFLPVEQAGKCMLSSDGTLASGGIDEIRQVLNSKQCLWHSGSIGGIIPNVIETV